MQLPDIRYVYYKTPIGELKLGVYRDEICLCDWHYRSRRQSLDEKMEWILGAKMVRKAHPLHENLIHQLEEYFEGRRETFDLPLKMVGTRFQTRVWTALLAIPYGQTRTYLELAKTMSNARFLRAYAAANGANTLAVIVPCHRVIGRDGQLVGYSGGLNPDYALDVRDEG